MNLFGEHRWVARGREDFLRHLSRHLMVAVTVAWAADKHGGHHQGPSHANHAHAIAQDALPGPLAESFLLGLRKAVVGDAGPVLIDSVVTSGLDQLHGADQAERVEIVGRHDIGATLAAVQGQQRNAGAASTRLVSQHAAIFVVRMRREHDQARAGVQLLQELPHRGRSAVSGNVASDVERTDRGVVRRLREGRNCTDTDDQPNESSSISHPLTLPLTVITRPPGCQRGCERGQGAGVRGNSGYQPAPLWLSRIPRHQEA